MGRVPHLVLNTKKDLALEGNIQGIYIDCAHLDRRRIFQEIEKLVAPKRLKAKSRGIISITIRALVVGIPNVGKSTFINRLVNKALAKTANIPGFTKAISIYKINEEFEIVDTPGVLYSKFENPETGLKLALIGSIKEDILPINEVFDYYMYVMQKYQSNFFERYKVSLNDPLMIEKVGTSKGLLFKGNIVDEATTKKVLIRELNNGILGKIYLD
jgi:ribosome biogenesis GTPase A